MTEDLSVTGDNGDEVASEPELDEIAEWLGRQGYPLELRIERACVAHGATDVTLGRRYVDPTDGATVRETDVVASWAVPGRDGRLGVLYLVVECKHDRRPWVGLGPSTAATHEAQAMFDLIYSEHLGPRADRDWLSTAMAHRDPGDDPTLFESGVLSHSILVKRDEKKNQADLAYSAVMAAFSASNGLLLDLARDELSSAGKFAGVGSVPVVVTTGPLFQAALDDTGELVVESVELLRVAFRPFLEPRARMCIVVRERSFEWLLERAEASARRLVPPPDLAVDVGVY